MNKIFKNQAYIFEGKVGNIHKNTPMLRIYSKDRWIQFFIWDNSNERSFPAYNYCEIVNDKYEVEQMIGLLFLIFYFQFFIFKFLFFKINLSWPSTFDS